MRYFEEKVLAGEWEEIEKYLSGFTKVDDNEHSMKIFFEIRKQKYLEALDGQNKEKAVDILVNDLKMFSEYSGVLFEEISQLVALGNFRQNEQLSKYGDTKTARSIMLVELKKLIETNPLLRDKLAFPTFTSSRLRFLVTQCVFWQHTLCKKPRPNPEIKTLFADHTCDTQNGTLAPVNHPTAVVAKPMAYTPLGLHVPFQPTAANPNAGALGGWMPNVAASSSVQAVVSTSSTLPIPSDQVSILKRPITPPATLGVEYHNLGHEPLIKRLRPAQSVEEVTYPTVRQHASWSLDDLPRTVAFTLHQGSTVTSLDFHPSHQTLLLVGCSNGELTLWEARIREKLISKPFKIWNAHACTLAYQACGAKGSPFSVTRVTWSPDGTFFGVAFSKRLIHLYAYGNPNDLRQHLEIDAHFGGVNDICFSNPNKQLCVITCGDDKLVKVWDLTGKRLFNFKGHEAPVYSVCTHQKENIQFIFSTAIDGRIKAWLYDNLGSRAEIWAPGCWCTTMLCSADGMRLFSCGSSKDGDIYLVEWKDTEGVIKRSYNGFRKNLGGFVQFDTAQNHFLAVGEDNQIKFWDMDNVNLLTGTYAEGGLPNFPRLRFNKGGSLLAVTTTSNGVKILANASGMRLLKIVGAHPFGKLKSHVEAAAMKVTVSSGPNVYPGSSAPDVAPGSSAPAVAPANRTIEGSSTAGPSTVVNFIESITRSVEKPNILDDANDKLSQTEIVDPVQCRVVTMSDSADTSDKVARLLYTNSAIGVLALGSNGVQKFWKWPRNEANPRGKANTRITPKIWHPKNGLVMKNDTSGVNLAEAVPCIALSKNDWYVVSAIGGKVSLFNMMTFKVVATFMPPRAKPSFLAFHPRDSNVIVVGMEDSTIHIYNIRFEEVRSTLKGHQKRISCLEFSTTLKVLVSSCVDAQLCFWNIDTWSKRQSITVQLPAGETPNGDTRVQFNLDQVRLLVVHETLLAIYDASTYERMRQWVPNGTLPAPISCAAYSCNSLLIFASFCDGNIGVFDGDTLGLRCRIAPSAYMSPALWNGSQTVHPLVVAAHPQMPQQFSIGLTDGSVKVIEPLESEDRWDELPPSYIGVPYGRPGSSSAARNRAPNPVQI